MKKIVLALASVALVFGMVSCASKQAEDEADFSMFVEEDEGPTWEATGEKLTNDACNTLAADTGVGVTIVVDKDMSKASNPVLQGAEVEIVTYLGEKCLKVTPNYNPEIRISFVFDQPITTEQFKGIKFACAGFDGGAGAYNCGLMYAKGDGGAEYPMSFYMTDISSTEWIECNANLKTDEQWGNRWAPDKEIQAIQFWSGDKGPLFIKGLSFVK